MSSFSSTNKKSTKKDKFTTPFMNIIRLLVPGPTRIWSRLIVSILIDIIGIISHFGFDFIWAPIQTILIMALYETTIPSAKYISFIEELLPFTDIIPTATIAWFIQHGQYLFRRNKNKANQEKKDDDYNNDYKKKQQQEEQEYQKQQQQQQRKMKRHNRMVSSFIILIIVIILYVLFHYRILIQNYLLVNEKELYTYIMNFNFTNILITILQQHQHQQHQQHQHQQHQQQQ